MKYKILTIVGISAVSLAMFFILQYGNSGKILAQAKDKPDAEPKSKFDLSTIDADTKIVFLHSDLGNNLWNAGMRDWFKDYNNENKKKYKIYEQDFPKNPTEKLSNLPCDYWNI